MHGCTVNSKSSSLFLSVHSIKEDANQSKENASSGQHVEDNYKPYFYCHHLLVRNTIIGGQVVCIERMW